MPANHVREGGNHEESSIQGITVGIDGRHGAFTRRGNLMRTRGMQSLKSNAALLAQLGQAYKQINAPFGPVAMDSLTFSTEALSGGTSSDDHAYLEAENQIQDWIDERDSIVRDMKTMLDAAEFGNQPINASEAKALIKEAQSLATAVHKAAM